MHRQVTLKSDDFPEFSIKLDAPTVAAWSDWLDDHGAGNNEEAELNLLIACGKIALADGAKQAPPTFGDICDEWPGLPHLAFGYCAEMAGAFVVGANAEALDMPAILAAAERFAGRTQGGTWSPPTSDADMALAKLAEQCAAFGLTADMMRAAIACNPRPGSYAAFLVPDVGAFVIRRPKFPQWSAYNRGKRNGHLQEAATTLALSCAEFPTASVLSTIIDKHPGVSVTLAAEFGKLVDNVRAEAKKD